ncbi:hypothetical protein DB43_DL00120 [Parachlamydia acanthamoebae]|nr:hypothetical protein DB43_DL00120 [Parachlamydia acanthamoebae]
MTILQKDVNTEESQKEYYLKEFFMLVTKKQPTNSEKKSDASQASQSSQALSQKHQTVHPKHTEKTRVVIHYDVGFNNHIYIRGKGADLSWDRGVKLKNVKSDEWVWETDIPFHSCEFKVLINDQIYEEGANHHLKHKGSVQYTPKFS